MCQFQTFMLTESKNKNVELISFSGFSKIPCCVFGHYMKYAAQFYFMMT